MLLVNKNRLSGALALTACFFLVTGPVPAGAEPAHTPPFPLGKKASRFLQKITGINFLTGFVASRVASSVVSHKLGGRVKVKVRTFSFTDLVAGKIKSLDVALDGSQYRGVPLGHLQIASQHPIWVRYRKRNGEKPGMLAPVLIKIQGSMAEKQLADALATQQIASKLRMIKLDLPGLGEQQLQLLEPQVDFRKSTVVVETLLVTQGASPETGVRLRVEGKPRLVGDSRIVLADMRVASPDIDSPEEFSSFFEKLLNPLVDFSRMDRRDHAFRMQKLKLTDDRAEFSGTLVLAPRNPPVAVADRKVTKP